ncbi:MAG: ketopantoate reductase family protein, partial [Promethearchaeota archaeon]
VVKNQCRVVRGLVTLASEMLSPGHVKVWRGEIILSTDELSKTIAQLFEKSGIRTKTSSTFAQEIWRKCIINSIINPLTAILQVQNNEISTPELAWIRHSIGRESIAVGTAEGIDFEADLINFIEEIVPKYTNRSSMCQDIQRGRPTEIEFINGRIVELGKEHGIPTPINKCLTQLVRFLEARSY